MNRRYLMTGLFVAFAVGNVFAEPSPAPVVGRVTHPAVKEASGLTRSRQHDGVFWAVSDSGSVSHLFAINSKGALLREYRVASVRNWDWESIATDDAGNLYVGDVGNNFGLPIRWVHVLKEPDPSAKSQETLPTVKPTTRLTYTFRRPPRADVEAMFHWQDRLFLISKSATKTEVYVLDPNAIGVQRLAPVATLPKVERVTGAAIDRHSRLLVLTGYKTATTYRLPDPTQHSPAVCRSPQKWRRLGQFAFSAPTIESSTLVGTSLLLLGENRNLYSVEIPQDLLSP